MSTLLEKRRTEELRERLTGELAKLGVTWISNLCMAAQTPQDEFVPTLVIVCTSLEDCRKIVHQLNPGRFVPRIYYKRLLNAGIKMAVVLDPVAGPKGLDAPQAAHLDNTSQISSSMELKIVARDEFKSLYGRLIRLVDHPSKSATFGCLVKIKHRLYGLTVAHPFAPHIGGRFEAMKLSPPTRESMDEDFEHDKSSGADTDFDSFEYPGIWSEPQVPWDIADDLDQGQETTYAVLTEDSPDPLTLVPCHLLGRVIALGWQDKRYCLPASFPTQTFQSRQMETLQASYWALIELSDSFIKNFSHLMEICVQLR